MPSRTPRLTTEHQSAKRNSVLLVGTEPTAQDSISTLLSMMGWKCTVVAGLEDILPAIQEGSFDALLLNLKHFNPQLERTILGIRQIRPGLSDRIVLLGNGGVDAEVIELIERYDLSYLPQEKVLSRLWSTLEDLVEYPAWSKVAARNIQTARLRFDSFRMPPRADVRSSSTSGRHFTYEHNNTFIDVLVDVQRGSNRISLVGQVLDATRPETAKENLPVVLTAGSETLGRTTTNQLGEFNLQFEYADNVSLEIRVGERSWISVPLHKRIGRKNECESALRELRPELTRHDL